MRPFPKQVVQNLFFVFWLVFQNKGVNNWKVHRPYTAETKSQGSKSLQSEKNVGQIKRRKFSFCRKSLCHIWKTQSIFIQYGQCTIYPALFIVLGLENDTSDLSALQNIACGVWCHWMCLGVPLFCRLSLNNSAVYVVATEKSSCVTKSDMFACSLMCDEYCFDVAIWH